MAKSPGAPTLILIPTEAESQALQRAGGIDLGMGLLACVGFGPLASGARCAQLLERLQPRRVLLVGIAGTLDLEKLPVGSAQRCGEVLLDGVGAGEGPDRLGPEAMGLPQWSPPGPGDPIYERLTLAGGQGRLLTVCAASASPEQAAFRREKFNAQAEDMEGFAVALACALAGVPLAIVRGISNAAGERDKSQWRLQEAMAAARHLALSTLEKSANGKGFPPSGACP